MPCRLTHDAIRVRRIPSVREGPGLFLESHQVTTERVARSARAAVRHSHRHRRVAADSSVATPRR